MPCNLPTVHRRISCYVAQHINLNYRCPVSHGHPVGHPVDSTVGHPACSIVVNHLVHETVVHLVCSDHKPLDHQSLLSWARMVKRLVECRGEVSVPFASWQSEE